MSNDNSCEPKFKKNTLEIEHALALAKQLKALADPSRLQMLAIIASATSGEVCVCDLVAPLGIGQSTVSHHLKILVEAGFLYREQRGIWAYYKTIPEAMQTISEKIKFL